MGAVRSAALRGALFPIVVLGGFGVLAALFLGPTYLTIQYVDSGSLLLVTVPPLLLGCVLACGWIAVWAELMDGLA